MKPSLYGKYAGKLEREKNYIMNCSEMELFIQVNAFYELFNSYNSILPIISYLEKMKEFYRKTGEEELEKYFSKKLEDYNKRKDNLIKIIETRNDSDDNEWNYAMDFCILQTAKFGTNVSYNPNGRVIITDQFAEWYNNWQSYVTYMDEDSLQLYRRCRYEGKGLDNFCIDIPLAKNKVIHEIDNIKPYTYQLTKKSTGQKFA